MDEQVPDALQELCQQLTDAEAEDPDTVDILALTRLTELISDGPYDRRVDHLFEFLLHGYLDHRPNYDLLDHLARRWLLLWEHTIGRNHPDLVPILQAVANYLSAVGRPLEATALLQRALTIQEAALGPDHPAVMRGGQSLAQHYQNCQHYAEAERWWRRYVLMLSRVLDEWEDERSRSDLWSVTGHLAECRRALSPDGEEPHGLGAAAHGTFRFGLREGAWAALVAMRELATLRRAQGRYAAAEAVIRRALALHPHLGPLTSAPGVTPEAHAWPPAPFADTEYGYTLVRLLQEQAAVLRATGRQNEAEIAYRQALPRLADLGALQSTTRVGLLADLAGLLSDGNRDDEAADIYHQALTAIDPVHTDLLVHATVLRDYATLLHRSQRGSEAAELEARLNALQPQLNILQRLVDAQP